MVEAGCTISRELLDSLPELLKLVSRQLPSPIEVGSADSLRPPPNAPTSCSENGPVSVGPSHSDKEKSLFSSTAVDASAADAAESDPAQEGVRIHSAIDRQSFSSGDWTIRASR